MNSRPAFHRYFVDLCIALTGIGLMYLASCNPALSQTPKDNSSDYQLKEHAGGIQILRGDKLVADYLTKSGSKPIIWPLMGPTGAKMTRDYPMVNDSKDEAHDHPHHRSLWFTHGEVNGVDFWLEGEGKGGLTEHLEFTENRLAKLQSLAAAICGSRPLVKKCLVTAADLHLVLTQPPTGSTARLNCERRKVTFTSAIPRRELLESVSPSR